MNYRIKLAAALSLGLCACGGGDGNEGAAAGGNAVAAGEQQVNAASPVALPAGVQVVSKEPYGQYLADASGRSLYVLEGARQSGSGTGAAGKTCTGECLTQWPAFSGGGPGQTQPGEEGRIATFAGWPLHYYAGDRDPGSTAGQGYRDRWGAWFLVSPSGEPIRGREVGPSAQ